MTALMVGVDGGGSKTACLATDWTGEVAGYASGGPSNHYAVGREQAAEALRGTIKVALERAGATVAQVSALCVGLAGVDRPGDRGVALELLAPLGLAVPPRVENDARVALAGALGAAPGVVVVAGTGSNILGQDGGGRTARAGGWGPLLGDEGSGYDVGRRGAIAALRAHDGRGSPTALKELFAAWAGGDVERLVPRFHRELDPAGVARLAGLVGEAARGGDKVAAAILDQAAAELALAVRTVATRLGLERPPVVAVGGLFRELDGFAARVARHLGWGDLLRPQYAPVVGAVWLAALAAGVEPGPVELGAWQQAVLKAGGHEL